MFLQELEDGFPKRIGSNQSAIKVDADRCFNVVSDRIQSVSEPIQGENIPDRRRSRKKEFRM